MINKIVKIVFIISMLSLNGQTIDIVFPEKDIGVDNWNIVNDGVMGGISTSSLSINSNSILIFKGYLSLENNGGFASSRMSIKKNILDNVKSFKIKFKGDGNKYKLRLRQDNKRVSYSCDFITIKNKWTEVDIPIKDFKATWRGYSYPNYSSIETDKINSIGLQISDKQEEILHLKLSILKLAFDFKVPKNSLLNT